MKLALSLVVGDWTTSAQFASTCCSPPPCGCCRGMFGYLAYWRWVTLTADLIAYFELVVYYFVSYR